MITHEPSDLLTLKQAAARLGLSVITLQQQARNGVLATRRIGRQYVVTPAALARYAAERQGKRGFASPAHPYHGTRPARRTEPTSSAPQSVPADAAEHADPPATTAGQSTGSVAEYRYTQSPDRTPAVDVRPMAAGSMMMPVLNGHAMPPARRSPARRSVFAGRDGTLYWINRNGHAVPTGADEIARWRAGGIDVIRTLDPEPWMLDAAADHRPDMERYRPLADYLTAHVPPGGEIALTFDQVEAILGFTLPPHRKITITSHYSRRSPAGMTWGMRGWNGRAIANGGGVRFRHGSAARGE